MVNKYSHERHNQHHHEDYQDQNSHHHNQHDKHEHHPGTDHHECHEHDDSDHANHHGLHDHTEHGPGCSCGCGHDTQVHNHNNSHRHNHSHNHSHVHAHDQESCPICSGHEKTTPEEYLNRIEESISKIPLKEKRERKNRLIMLSAATAAAAAEHKDSVLLQIVEVYLALRLADESGIQVAPEEGVRVFRELSGIVGLGLTAKYGLDGLTKVSFDNTQSTASLVFVTCYGIGKVLADYYKKHVRGLSQTVDEAKEIFQSARKEAERLTVRL